MERVVGVTDAGGDGELESFKVVCIVAGSVRYTFWIPTPKSELKKKWHIREIKVRNQKGVNDFVR